MKNNFITLKDKNGKSKDFRILLDLKNTTENVNYIIYTDDKKESDGSISAYASSYILSEKGNITKLKAISEEKEFDFLTELLDSLEINN